MEIEVLNFYEIRRDDAKGHLVGTLHIRLKEFGMNIKSIWVNKRNNKYYIGFPSKTTFDHKTNKIVRYGVIMFDDPEKQAQILANIKIQGCEFIENYLKTNEPMTEPPKNFKKNKPKVKQNNQKKMPPPNAIKKIATKEWVDPPPLKKKIGKK